MAFVTTGGPLSRKPGMNVYEEGETLLCLIY
jgi:hypothetical protein